jgi:O-antigen/teichoic acid export membrane protein
VSRYLVSAVEQALWSLLNLGVNLLLIRLCAPSDYGAFALWSTCGYVLASLQNALSVCHLQVLAPGDGLDEARLPVERLMHGVTAVFLLAVAGVTLMITLALRGAGSAFGAPAAALFVPAFLLQQYIRALAFSRGRPTTAAIQTGLVLLAAAAFLGAAALMSKTLSADAVLICIGGGYGLVGVVGAARALRGQMTGFRAADLAVYGRYAAQSGWIFLGVTTTELLTRFYAFVVAGWFGAAALGSLTATQLLLRPVLQLASSWSMVARADLARRRDARDWPSFLRLGLGSLVGGVAIAAVWTFFVHAFWALISARLFGGKYGSDGWMVVLWGVSMALGFGQVVVNTGLQVLREFKALALANAAASAVAAAAVLIVARLYGIGGSIVGTAAGQAFEFAVMGVVMMVFVSRHRRTSARPKTAPEKIR